MENLSEQANIWTRRSPHKAMTTKPGVANRDSGAGLHVVSGGIRTIMEPSSACRGSVVEVDRGEWPPWPLLRRLASYTRRPGFNPDRPVDLRLGADGELVPMPLGETRGARWAWRPGHGWVPGDPQPDAETQAMFDLYLPLCAPTMGSPRLLGHLGQSLDGFIATGCGDSCFVTGPENIRHLHRLRALSDAVLVGTETAACDDPRLTTRLVPGDNPVRVVLDRQRRLPPGLRLFTDGAAETLICCDRALIRREGEHQGVARVLGIPCRDGRLDLRALVEALADRGLDRLFVEGGGALVSAFLAQGLLDRLHLTLAPLLIGTGRPGLRIPAPDRLADVQRPTARLFQLGADLLYDLTLTPGRRSPGPRATGLASLARVY